MPPEKQPQYATRSLLSRSWVDWAIEAARQVGGEPVVTDERRVKYLGPLAGIPADPPALTGHARVLSKKPRLPSKLQHPPLWIPWVGGWVSK